MSRFLINEPPLLVSKTLSCIIGLNEALVLQQIHYYQEISKNIYDEKQWVYNSVANWKKEHFPFWSEATIKRALNSLESKGLLFSANYNKDPRDQTKWYSVDYTMLSKLESEHVTNAFGQNDQMESSKMTKCNEADCTNALDHHDPMHRSNMTQPLPKTTTENTSEITTEITTENNSSCQVHAEPDQAQIVLEHFNKVTKSSYRDGKTTMGHIRARLAEDYVAEDLILVTDYITAKWLNDAKMSDYLRPKTLFSPENCMEYFEKAQKWHEAGRPACVNGKWLKPGEVAVSIDPVERDEVFTQLFSTGWKPANRIQEIAKKMAGKSGLGRLSEFAARSAWKGIWQKAAEQAAKEQSGSGVSA